MQHLWHKLALGIVVSAAFAACTNAEQPTPARSSIPEARSDKQRLAADAPSASVMKLTHDDTDFAFDLLRAKAPDGNFFYSPHSISIALAMTYAGASNDAKTQMANVLHFEQPDAELHAAFNTLDQTLASRGAGAKASDGQPFRLRIANALWAEHSDAFLPTYLDVLAENYGAGVKLVDFSDSEAARHIINGWVSDQTEQKIPELLPKGLPDPNTTFVLTNTVYFNAAWAKPFDPAYTADGSFTRLDASKVTVPFMHGEGSLHAQGDGWQAAELAYDGGEVSMLILVPDAGRFGEIAQSMSADRLDEISASLHSADVIDIALPKFQARTHLELKETLSAMGMPALFAPGSLVNMSGDPGLYVTHVIHEAFVKVNEAGTEAAAATAVIGGGLSLPTNIVKLDVDRPFLFVIRDRATGASIFVGQIADPSQ